MTRRPAKTNLRARRSMNPPLAAMLTGLLGVCACASTETMQEGDDNGDTSALGDDTAAGDGATESGDTGSEDAGDDGDNDYAPTEDDFTCLLEWTKVRNYFLTNLQGDLDASLAVANAPDGGVFPAGTLIQLIPTEAMVKRGAGFDPATNDWEFFSLEVSAQGTTILDRGTTDVINQFGGNCLECHQKAMPQWDFVCEKDHGCDPLPLTDDLIASVQQSDPRCN